MFFPSFICEIELSFHTFLGSVILNCALLFREEELQLQKRKKRKIKGNSRLSFTDDIEDGDEEDEENSKHF